MSGTMACFSAYSGDLTTRLGSNADTIGAAGDFGVYTGFLMGMIDDNCGIGISLTVGTVLISFGYFVTYLMTSDIMEPNYAAFILTYFLIGQGSFSFLVTSLSSQMTNFHKNQRTIVSGALLGAYAYSAIVWTLVFIYMTQNDISSFYKIMGISALCIGLIGIIFMRNITQISANTFASRANDDEDVDINKISEHNNEPTAALMAGSEKTVYDAATDNELDISVDSVVRIILYYHIVIYTHTAIYQERERERSSDY